MAGEVASLLISRMAVPILYYMAHARAGAAESAGGGVAASGPGEYRTK